MSQSISEPFKALNRQTFRAGEVIFEEGKPGAAGFLVEVGTIEISKNVDGRSEYLGIIEKGGIFGEMALVDDEPRMATAKALTHCVCVVIPKRQFQAKVAKADPLIRALLRIFVRNIRSQTALRFDTRFGPVD